MSEAVEVGAEIAGAADDPYVRQQLVGGILGWRASESFAVVVWGGFSPRSGQGDWRPVSARLVNEERVWPEMTEIRWVVSPGFEFAPISATFEGADTRVDVVTSVGFAALRTSERFGVIRECLLIDCYPAYEEQTHGGAAYGAGLRVVTGRRSVRLEARSLRWVETFDETTLEVQHPLMLSASVSWRVGRGG